MTLLDGIDKIIAALKRRQSELLAKQLSSAFVAGFKTAPGNPRISQVRIMRSDL